MATPATKRKDNLPVVAIVGRVNVGKSTLFNRLIEEHKAIVSDVPGTTRTNNEGVILWRGKQVRIIDTGGLTFDDDVQFEADIVKQAEKAMADADVILFVTDGQVGILPQERELAKKLRHAAKKPILLIANKIDHGGMESNLHEKEWYSIGFGEPFSISAISGRKTGDLLDEIYSMLGKTKRRPKLHKEATSPAINVSLIGKPNVGKSSLFNKLIGEEKVIVSDIAHTTREPHDTMLEYKHVEGKKTVTQRINFIDTAGIRRKSKVDQELEVLGVKKSIETIENSDIVLFVIDGHELISSQDMQLGGLLEKRSKSVIILVNKWDLSDDVSDTKRNDVKRMVYSYFPHLDFAPILFVSGLTGFRVHQIFPEIIRAWKARHTEIVETALEHFIKKAIKEHRPARGKGTRHPEVLGMRQLRANPPIFEIMIKQRTSIHRSYVHFLENKLREQFDFFAVPIVIKMSKLKR